LLNIIDSIIRVKMLRLLPRSVSGLTRSCRTLTRRQLFTDQYLGLVSYKELRLQQLERLKERQNLPRLRSVIFSSADAGQLLSSDLHNISLMVDSEQTLQAYQNLVFRYINLHAGSPACDIQAYKAINTFCKLCHLNSAADKLEATFKKKQVKEILTRKNVFDDYLLCADLLYKHERFKDVVSLCKDLRKPFDVSDHLCQSLLALLLLSLVRLDTAGGFAVASSYLNLSQAHGTDPGAVQAPPTKSVETDHLIAVYAWLACKDGRFETAFEVLRCGDGLSYKKSLHTNILLFALLKLNRVEEAVLLLEEVVDDLSGPSRTLKNKPKFSKDVIKLMVDGVNVAEEKEELRDELKSQFARLDYVAAISDLSIEDILLGYHSRLNSTKPDKFSIPTVMRAKVYS